LIVNHLTLFIGQSKKLKEILDNDFPEFKNSDLDISTLKLTAGL
jgi:hypothetical protein